MLIPGFTKELKQKPHLIKCLNGNKLKDSIKRLTRSHNLNSKKMYYFRYVDNFFICVKGSKQDCKELKNQIQEFLEKKLKLMLNVKTQKNTTKAELHFAKFLGYKFYKIKTKINLKDKMVCSAFRQILDVPISEIIRKLELKGYVKKNKPTRNVKLTNLTLDKIISHYKTVERKLLNYYSLANNFNRFLRKIHCIFKYSCVLTIASKMKLKTMKKVFRKYGKNIFHSIFLFTNV